MNSGFEESVFPQEEDNNVYSMTMHSPTIVHKTQTDSDHTSPQSIHKRSYNKHKD